MKLCSLYLDQFRIHCVQECFHFTLWYVSMATQTYSYCVSETIHHVYTTFSRMCMFEFRFLLPVYYQFIEIGVCFLLFFFFFLFQPQ